MLIAAQTSEKSLGAELTLVDDVSLLEQLFAEGGSQYVLEIEDTNNLFDWTEMQPEGVYLYCLGRTNGSGSLRIHDHNLEVQVADLTAAWLGILDD